MIRYLMPHHVGSTVGVSKYRGHTIQVKRGNDITGTDLFGRSRVYKTLITESEVKGERHYACHVIVPFFLFESAITKRRIREAIFSWCDALDDLLDN